MNEETLSAQTSISSMGSAASVLVEPAVVVVLLVVAIATVDVSVWSIYKV